MNTIGDVLVVIATGGGVYHIVEDYYRTYCGKRISSLWPSESIEPDHPRICANCRRAAKA